VTIANEAGDTAAIEERLLTPGEVAALFRVDRKTASRWGAAGRLGAVRTPGNRVLFRESAVREALGMPGAPAR
jgi:excisionase family DNA binding protein